MPSEQASVTSSRSSVIMEPPQPGIEPTPTSTTSISYDSTAPDDRHSDKVSLHYRSAMITPTLCKALSFLDERLRDQDPDGIREYCDRLATEPKFMREQLKTLITDAELDENGYKMSPHLHLRQVLLRIYKKARKDAIPGEKECLQTRNYLKGDVGDRWIATVLGSGSKAFDEKYLRAIGFLGSTSTDATAAPTSPTASTSTEASAYFIAPTSPAGSTLPAASTTPTAAGNLETPTGSDVPTNFRASTGSIVSTGSTAPPSPTAPTAATVPSTRDAPTASTTPTSREALPHFTVLTARAAPTRLTAPTGRTASAGPRVATTLRAPAIQAPAPQRARATPSIEPLSRDGRLLTHLANILANDKTLRQSRGESRLIEHAASAHNGHARASTVSRTATTLQARHVAGSQGDHDDGPKKKKFKATQTPRLMPSEGGQSPPIDLTPLDDTEDEQRRMMAVYTALCRGKSQTVAAHIQSIDQQHQITATVMALYDRVTALSDVLVAHADSFGGFTPCSVPTLLYPNSALSRLYQAATGTPEYAKHLRKYTRERALSLHDISTSLFARFLYDHILTKEVTPNSAELAQEMGNSLAGFIQFNFPSNRADSELSATLVQGFEKICEQAVKLRDTCVAAPELGWVWPDISDNVRLEKMRVLPRAPDRYYPEGTDPGSELILVLFPSLVRETMDDDWNEGEVVLFKALVAAS